MMIALAIAVVLILMVLVASVYMFLYTFKGREGKELSLAHVAKGTQWEKHLPAIQEGKRWLADIPSHEVSVKSKEGFKLVGRFVPAAGAKGIILMMHGYRSQASNDFGSAAPFFHGLGYHMLFTEERAHGKSEGNFIGFGVLERYDCAQWISYLCEAYPGMDIFLDGLSMGAATVLMASGLNLPENVRGIIADCGFTSPWEICKYVLKRKFHLPAFPVMYVANWLCNLFAGYDLKAYTVKDAMEKNTIPVFFVHGEEDRFVPMKMTIQNYTACKAEKELLLIEGAYHAESYQLAKEEYQKRVVGFLTHHASPKKENET